jgi:phage N-6-adenine-methyltransferase
MLNNSLFSSAKDDWETPDNLFNDLDKEFTFTLDPCCFPHTAKCSTYFTLKENGLVQDWRGVVFMNPPYGRETGKWVSKAFEEASKGCIVVCLIPSRTDTKWWHSYCMRATEIRFLTRRLTFKGGTNKATFPSAVVIFTDQKTLCPTLKAQYV